MIAKGIWKVNSCPRIPANTPAASAGANDHTCWFSYRRACSSDDLFPNARLSNIKSQTAREKPELQISNKDTDPLSIPATAKKMHSKRHTNGSHEVKYFRDSSQAGHVMIAATAPGHCPAMPYPAVRQNTEPIKHTANKVFRGAMLIDPYLSLCPRERTRAFRTNGNSGRSTCQSMTGICRLAILFNRRQRSRRVARIANRLTISGSRSMDG